MNTFLNPPVSWLPDSTNAENEIREIFFRHWEKMKDHFIMTVNEINTWRHKFIEDTNKYADNEICILTADYERLRLSLNEKCEENLDTTRAYVVAQNIELFNELRSACRVLEFQMAQLESINGTMKGLKVITVEEQMERKKKEKSDLLKSENDNLAQKSVTEHSTNSQNNQNEKGNLSVTVTLSISNETNSNSSAVKSLNVDTRPINDNSNSGVRITDGHNLINKCPICFMIFPMNMTHDHRSQHINEHCTDN